MRTVYNDIVILPISENMNSGKTYAFFSWAASNAWVPPLYFDTSLPLFSYANITLPQQSLAPHDPHYAWNELISGRPRPWVRPDFVVKADDDSFVMLAELEARLRVEIYSEGQKPYSSLANRVSILAIDIRWL